MSENTKIEWADHTFNPWTGCTKVSPGCDGCYAEAWAKRSGTVQWGAAAPRRRTSEANWRQPLKWNRQAEAEGRRYRVFCASLADVFDNQVPVQWRADLLQLIDLTPNLDWLLLTKRIGNVVPMLQSIERAIDGARALDLWPRPNIWLGATVVNQEEADRDIPKLLKVPARVRFLSIEPMLGPISFEGMFANPLDIRDGTNALEALDWVIAGGESGPQARPAHPDWFRSLRDQCTAAGVPFLFKQWGEWGPLEQNSGLGWKLGDERTGFFDGDSWHHMGVSSHGAHMLRVGKKATGRLLDGTEHNGFPEAA